MIAGRPWFESEKFVVYYGSSPLRVDSTAWTLARKIGMKQLYFNEETTQLPPQNGWKPWSNDGSRWKPVLDTSAASTELAAAHKIVNQSELSFRENMMFYGSGNGVYFEREPKTPPSGWDITSNDWVNVTGGRPWFEHSAQATSFGMFCPVQLSVQPTQLRNENRVMYYDSKVDRWYMVSTSDPSQIYYSHAAYQINEFHYLTSEWEEFGVVRNQPSKRFQSKDAGKKRGRNLEPTASA